MRTKRWFAVLMVGVIAGLIVGSLSLASAQDSGSETLVVIAQPAREQFVDLGVEGESAGDMFVFKETLWDEDQQTRLGTSWVDCTLNFGGVAVCKGALQLEGRGHLTGTGAVRLAATSFSFPITGGTGDFANVTGWARITSIQDGERIVIHLNNVVTA